MIIPKLCYTFHMTLETIFYAIGIIAMSLWIVMALALVAVYFYVQRQIRLFKENVQAFHQGIPGRIFGFLKHRNVEVATGVGLSLTSLILNKIKKNLRSKKS